MRTAQPDPLEQVTCRLGDASCAGAHASRLSRATASQPPKSADSLLNLQRSYGNRYVQRVVALSRQGDGETEVAPEVEDAIQAARGGGQGLDSAVRARMEPAFGADFGGVRVHADAQADTLNRSLSARAFTTGQDIFFKQGEYDPNSSSGRELLAHELTHVMQQSGDRVQPKLDLGLPGDRYEQEADSLARAVSQQEQRHTQPQASSASGTRIQRLGPLVGAAGAATASGAAITEPIEVIAALAGIASLAGQVYSGGSGGLSYSSTTGDRLSENTQPKTADCEAICLRIEGWGDLLPDIDAVFKVIWQGNDYGEIGAARVRVDIDRTSEFILSSLNVRFETLRNLIQPGGDRRTWQMQWEYEGTFDPVGIGEWWFQGSFAIDAFGNFTSLTHTVRDFSLISGTPVEGIVSPSEGIVWPGGDIWRDIPPPPTGPSSQSAPSGE